MWIMFKIIKSIPKTYLKISLVILAVSYLVISFLFRYEDIVSYTVWSVNFWDLLFEGRLGDFYAYSEENIRQAPHGIFCGSYLTIFPWILWNFPLYLTHRLPANVRVDSLFCILWSKVLLLICIAGIGFYSYKIVRNIVNGTEEQAWLSVILSVGGYEIINSTAYAGQDEVIYVVCILAAVYYLLMGRRKSFLICSCMSVTICPIMLVPYLAAYLIYEKNILKILGTTLVVLLPSMVFEIVYRHVELYQRMKGTNTISIFESMLGGQLVGTALGSVSMVGIAFILLFFICYISHHDEKSKQVFLIYMIAVSFFIICFMAPFNVFYRFGIYTPFWAILLVTFYDRIDMNIFLLTVICYGRAFLSLGYTLNPNIILTQNWNSKFLMPEILSLLEGEIQMRATAEMAANILGDLYFMFLFLVRTVVFAAAIILMMTNWKGWSRKVGITISYKISLLVYVCSSILVLGAFVICIL